jgi:hypothetical protein
MSDAAHAAVAAHSDEGSGVDKSSYHRDYKRVSKTMLGHFLKSRFDYYRYYVAKTESPPAPKRVMQVGSAIHSILLDRTSIDDVVAVYPASCLKSDGSLNPKPASKFREDHPDHFIMKDADYDLVHDTCEAVRKHELGTLIDHPDAVFEVPKQWTCKVSGLDCRMMADFYTELDDRVICYDLKTTEDIYPTGVARTCKVLKYWLQDAHYSAGLEAIFGKPVFFKFWFVEINAPHRIAPYEYDPRSREIAASSYQKVMVNLADCYATGDWADEWEKTTNQLVINPWEVDEAALNEEVAYVGDED